MEQKQLPIEFRDKRNSDWYWISRLVYEEYSPLIGIIGLALYNAYASYARDKAEAWPSLNTISKKLKISIPTIIKYNKILEKYKLIEIKSGKEAGRSNVIYLLKVKGIKQVNTQGIKQVNTRYKRSLDPGIKQVNTNDKNNNEKNIISPYKGDRQKPASLQEKKEFGNGDINYLIGLLKEKTGLNKLDGTEKQNRRYCWLAMKKFGGRQKVEAIIKIALHSDFHRKNLTSMKYIYYNGVKIVSEFKDKIENPIGVKIK